MFIIKWVDLISGMHGVDSFYYESKEQALEVAKLYSPSEFFTDVQELKKSCEISVSVV